MRFWLAALAAFILVFGGVSVASAKPQHPLPKLFKVDGNPQVKGVACQTPGLWRVSVGGNLKFQCTYKPAREFFEEKTNYWLKQNGKTPKFFPKPPGLKFSHFGEASGIVTQDGAIIYKGGLDKAKTIYGRRLVSFTLNSYLARRFPDSPLLGKGLVFAQESEKRRVDPRLPLAIAVCETGAGTDGGGPAVHNPFGILLSGSRHKRFSNWRKGIAYEARLLRVSYLDQGLGTIAEMGTKYAPVGAANDRHNKNSFWVSCVSSVYGSGLGGTEYLPNKFSKWQEKQAIRRRISQYWQDIAKNPGYGHYSQRRPIPNIVGDITVEYATSHDWWGDCSGTVTWINWRAGLPLPPAGTYSWTGSQDREYRHVYMPALGDSILYNGHIVGIIGFRNNKPTRNRHDIFVGSMGSESGPYGYPKEELTADYRGDFIAYLRAPGL